MVTTSVKDDHLRVLWGEIGRFINTAKYPLRSDKGGNLTILHRDLGRLVKGVKCDISYLRGLVSETEEGLSGHHAAHTLAIVDEASAVSNKTYSAIQGWAKRLLAFGNPNNSSAGCDWWEKAVKGGSLEFKPYKKSEEE